MHDLLFAIRLDSKINEVKLSNINISDKTLVCKLSILQFKLPQITTNFNSDDALDNSCDNL